MSDRLNMNLNIHRKYKILQNTRHNKILLSIFAWWSRNCIITYTGVNVRSWFSTVYKIKETIKENCNPNQTGVSESLIRGGGGKYAPQRKLAIFLHCMQQKWDQGPLETKVDPHWVQDPPWSFNGLWHGPTIHPSWPFIYWLYFRILCNKKEIKGLWGYTGWPP